MFTREPRSEAESTSDFVVVVVIASRVMVCICSLVELCLKYAECNQSVFVFDAFFKLQERLMHFCHCHLGLQNFLALHLASDAVLKVKNKNKSIMQKMCQIKCRIKVKSSNFKKTKLQEPQRKQIQLNSKACQLLLIKVI